MFEKEISDLTVSHTNIMKDIENMETLIKEEKRDYTTQEIDSLEAKIHEAEEKRVAIEDYKAKANRAALIEQNRSFQNQPKQFVLTSEPASVVHSARTNMQEQAWRNYLRAPFKSYAGAEMQYRALVQDTDNVGGYLNAPANWSSQIIQALDNEVFMRTKGTVLPALTGSDTAGFPVLETDFEDHTWTTEILQDEDTTTPFNKRELKPNMLAKYIKVSMKLLNISNFPVEAYIRGRLQYKLSGTLETAYMTGSGTGEPLGLFTDSASGISTDVVTTFDYAGFCEGLSNLKSKYWPNASWVMTQDAFVEAIKMLDSNGRPIYQPSMAAGVPGTIFGRPVLVSAYSKATDNSSYFVIFGDLSKYWIIDHANFGIQRCDELGALTNQVYFVSRWMSDGAPVLAEAFTRLTMVLGS